MAFRLLWISSQTAWPCRGLLTEQMTKKSVKEVTSLRSRTLMSSAFFSSALRTAISQFGISVSTSEAAVREECVDGVPLSPALSVLHWQRVRKWLFSGLVPVIFCIFSPFSNGVAFAQLSDALLTRAKANVERVRALVADGTLPPASLTEAEERLADAQDQETLTQTLYSPTLLQNITPTQASEMLAAASRRVDREQTLLETRQKLLDMGIISQSEMSTVRNELNSRRLVLDLARNRLKLLDELKQMAALEQPVHIATLQNSMIRYDGSAPFTLSDLPKIQLAFKAQFREDLPVSAIGETAVHESMGLDHRNKVDVALNPERPEGLWLRHYLEKHHFPYLAFRNALAGAATGAHIHIGTGSTRLTARNIR